MAFKDCTISQPLQHGLDSGSRFPGDAVFDGTLYVPETLKPGTYKLRVAMLDPRTETPAIQLAIEGRQPDGWYDLGPIAIQ